MHHWLRRVRGALGMGLTWAAGFGVGVGGLIELLDNILPAAHPFTRLVDMWPQTLAIPGFVGGVLFAALLAVAGGGRQLGELARGRVAAIGAGAGLLLGAVGMASGAPVLFLLLTTAGSTLAAAASLALARTANDRGLLAAGPGAPIEAGR